MLSAVLEWYQPGLSLESSLDFYSFGLSGMYGDSCCPLSFLVASTRFTLFPGSRFLLIWEQVDQLDRNREDLDPFLTRRSCDDGSAKKRKNQ